MSDAVLVSLRCMPRGCFSGGSTQQHTLVKHADMSLAVQAHTQSYTLSLDPVGLFPSLQRILSRLLIRHLSRRHVTDGAMLFCWQLSCSPLLQPIKCRG